MQNERSEIDPFDRIIWSADVLEVSDLLAALEQLADLRLVKLDRLFLEGNDLGIIDQVQELGFKVFDDSKMIEVPTKLRELAHKHLRHKPWMLNCMAGSVSSLTIEHQNPDMIDGLKMFADACHEAGTLPCGVTVLTAKKPHVVSSEFNGRSPIDQVLTYVGILARCGFTDIVCSPEEVAAIRSVPDFDHLNLNTPGIRLPDSKADDQARTSTPEGAVAAGATRLVIGRPITVGDKALNLKTIADRLLQAV